MRFSPTRYPILVVTVWIGLWMLSQTAGANPGVSVLADETCDLSKGDQAHSPCLCNKQSHDWVVGKGCLAKCPPGHTRRGDGSCTLSCFNQNPKTEDVDGQCLEKCPMDKVRVANSKVCAAPCGFQQHHNPEGKCIPDKCQGDLELIGEQCLKPCALGMERLANHECGPKCEYGKVRGPAGACITECLQHQELVNGHCENKCSVNFKRDEKGQCNYCPDH